MTVERFALIRHPTTALEVEVMVADEAVASATVEDEEDINSSPMAAVLPLAAMPEALPTCTPRCPTVVVATLSPSLDTELLPLRVRLKQLIEAALG